MTGPWMDPAQDPRYVDVVLRGERAVLTDYLRTYRLTLQLKCEGLDAEQLARRPVPSSTMSLLGLLRHLAFVEHNWFATVMDGQDTPRPFDDPDDRDADFNGAIADDAVVAEAWRVWRAEVAFATAYADSHELDALGTMKDGSQLELREVLVHLIEEYARHCGHADLLRELIDGRTGQ